jgi:hypothetical protein
LISLQDILRCRDTQHNDNNHNVFILSFGMLSVIISNVLILGGSVVSVFMVGVFMLSFRILGTFMLSFRYAECPYP